MASAADAVGAGEHVEAAGEDGVGDLPLGQDLGKVTRARVDELGPSHIILSGQSHPWTMYSPESLAGVLDVIRGAEQPVLGVCGGHQQIALCHGATVGLIRRIAPGEGYEGAFRERGFVDVDVRGDGLFAGLPARITVWASRGAPSAPGW